MKNFFKKILNNINKFDSYTYQYKKYTNNIELPSLAYTNWGLHFAQIKDFKTAIEKLEVAISMPNKSPKPCISLGIIYAKLKEYEKAEITLKKALERDSQNGYTYSVLSSVLVAENKFEEAEDIIKKGLKLAPSDSELYLNYGILYSKLKKKIKAAEMFKKAKLLDPINPHVYFLLGVMLFETDKTAEAFTEFKELEKLKPDYKNLNYYLALCYKKEKNYMAVMEYAQRALEEDNENPAIYILFAQNYLTLNKKEEALKVFEIGNSRGIDDIDFSVAWSVALIKANRTKEAKEKLENVLKINENNSTAIFYLGLCNKKEYNFEKAEEFFTKAISINPENTSAISELGLLYYDLKRYDDAVKMFSKAINLSVENTYLYFYIANCYYKTGKYKRSIEYYEKTLEYHPTHLEALINYTVNLLDIDNPKEALRKIRTAYQINRKSEKVLLAYALTGLKAGIYSDAIEKADLLLAEQPDNIDAKMIKSQALLSQGKAQEALNVLYSIKTEQQNFAYFAYLAYCAYKILAETSPTNYNETMLNLYFNKYNELKEELFDKSGVSMYIYNALNSNINKG